MPIDYSKYPSNWKTEIRPAILERAQDCCEVCGLSNGETVYSVKVESRSVWFQVVSDALRASGAPYLHGHEHLVKTVKVVLTIAHLDHDETNQNVSLDRLKAMCQMCHLTYDREEKMRRRLTKT